MIKNWKDMSVDEKSNSVGKIAQLRGTGFTWDEIGEFYNIPSNTIRNYYDTHKVGKTAQIAQNIITGSDKVEITADILCSLFEQIEQLKLEVASVKKLQVENAAIERLDETEYKYFIYKNTELLEKFKDLDGVSDYLYNETGIRFHSVNIGRQLQNNIEWRCKGFTVKQCFKNENDNMSRELETWKIEGKLLQNELENIKSNL